MVASRMMMTPPRDFNFWRTVYSHGWCTLPPFRVDKERGILHRSLSLSDDAHVACEISGTGRKLNIRILSGHPLTAGHRSEIRSQILQCLRLKEDLTDFYAEARKHGQYRWIPRFRAGRLLRAPTVFEDVVKMMCTTNCSWALTENMVKNLTTKLSNSLGTYGGSFPTPAALAGVTESFMRKEIKSGYRSPYLLELSEKVAEGSLALESWRESPLSTEQLYEQVLSVKGIGEYAAGNIMRLLGRYDYLALDSWVRKKFSELHRNGRKVSDARIEKYYRPFGRWKGLFFWLEMTEDWYTEQFPF